MINVDIGVSCMLQVFRQNKVHLDFEACTVPGFGAEAEVLLHSRLLDYKRGAHEVFV